jgi:phage-related protein
MYVAKFEEPLYVLHCFQKKTQTTSQRDKEIAASRYRAVIQQKKEQK